MSHKTQLHALTAAVAAAASTCAWALEPQSIRLGDSLNFSPSLQVTESYDDNIRAVETGELSSWVTRISPAFTLGADGHKANYQVQYRADSDTFHSSHLDDNTDHHLTAKTAFNFNVRNHLTFDIGYHRVELLDSENSDHQSQNDKYNTIDAGALYSFGAPRARGQIDFGVRHQRLRYENTQHINDDLEREFTQANTIFYYRLAPRTRALIEARYTDFNYVSNDLRNSSEIALLGGLAWEATAKTTGTIKIGSQKKHFEESSVGNMSGSMWEIGIDWKPRTYSTVSLTTRQAIDENYQSGIGASAVESTLVKLGWKHSWTNRLSSETSYSYIKRKYQDYDRDDRFDIATLDLTYELRRWLDVSLGLKYIQKDSTRARESYERSIIGLTVAASL